MLIKVQQKSYECWWIEKTHVPKTYILSRTYSNSIQTKATV